MKIGIIGCGKMASAVAVGLNSKNKNLEFFTYSASFNSAEKLATKISGIACGEVSELKSVNYIIIGCKPQNFDQLVLDVKGKLPFEDKIVVSIMAAISIESIQEKLATKDVARLMPSMPITISKGISLFYFSGSIAKTKRTEFMNLFSETSKNFLMKTQEQFNQVTTISSSGPAYVYYLMSIFASKLEKFSMSSEDALALTCELFKGSSSYAQLDGKPLESMINAVTSKAGVTIEAVNTFKELRIDEAIDRGVDNAYTRSVELEKLI